MKQIYKRQPVQHDLPTNYDDLDAINYNNISNFKGLQVYDNPLIADQESTYSCKNVYVDEHGNLTIRPALVPVSSDSSRSIIWSHTFNDGNILQLKYLENQYVLDANFTDATMTFSSDSVPNIVPVDTGDNKYIFIQDTNIGSNVLYKIGDSFEQVEGTVLLDDPLDTDIAHYNILNNKIKYEYAGKNLGSVRSEDEYNINYVVPFAIDWAKPHKIQLLGDDTLVIATQNRFIISSPMNFINLEVDTGYQRDSNDWCIRILNGEIEITVACLNEDPVGSKIVPGKDSVGAYFLSGCVKRFILSLDGEVLSEYTATISGAGLFAGYGYAIILISTGGVTDDYGNKSYELYTKELNSDFDTITTEDLKDGWKEIELPINLYPVIRYKYEGYLPVGYYGRVVAFADGLAYIRRDYTASNPPLQHVYCRRYDGAMINDGLYLVNDEATMGVKSYSIFDDTILSEANHLYLKGQNYHDARAITFVKENDGRVTSNTRKFSEVTDTAIALSSRAIYSSSGNSIFEQDYLSTTPVEYTFKETSIFATNTIAITSNGDSTLVYRSPKLLSAIIDRDTSVIPVLSEINEHVVTGFFLDNCWWFITEHSIFGTGADANGLQTPERFDPLKYFKVSEVITGAIRISDTSFWVFHNNGAYLIYKTSLALSSGTEYRWLCTATAKSKGCDFENALATLPVSSNIVTVTGEDICNVIMKENVQSDERTLVPMTTQFSVIMRELLQKTSSVKILNYKYLTIFFLNPIEETGITPAVVFDNITNSWWQWEFPVQKVYSVDDFRQEYTDKIEYTARLRCKTKYGVDQFYLTDDEHYWDVGTLKYEVYCDRLLDDTSTLEEVQIDWMWQSAIQLFGTLIRRKQLLFTTFVFDDYLLDEDAQQDINIGYYFNIYSKQYTTSKPDSTTASVYRVSNNPCRTMISNYNYLQLVLHSCDFDGEHFEVLTKPKICCISMKYRILRGEWT